MKAVLKPNCLVQMSCKSDNKQETIEFAEVCQSLTAADEKAMIRNRYNRATSWENLFMPYANNKGADQPARPRSLISAFVVRYLDSIIPLVSISEISSLCLASVAAQTGLSLPWLQTPKTGFLVTRLNCISHPAEDTKRERNKRKKTRIIQNNSFPADDQAKWTEGQGQIEKRTNNHSDT